MGTGTALGRTGQLYGIRQQQRQAEALAAAQAFAAAELERQKELEETEAAFEAVTREETQPETEAADQPSPDKLNLAYFYPEDSDSSEIIDSYAGQVFQELTILDSEWLADIYELADVKPSAMAQRLGKSQDSIMGTYNLKDEAHDPEDPSSWTINNWKRIHVSFADGDGRAISGFSNVKDILSMASVYTYYTDMMDVDAFSAYARQLWEASHSYTIRMGDVYYCDGCMDKTDEEIAMEEEMDEEAAAAALSSEEGFAAAALSDEEESAGDSAAGAPASDHSNPATSDFGISGSEVSDSEQTSASESSSDFESSAASKPSPDLEPSSESVTVIRRSTVPEDTSFASPGDTGTPGFAGSDPASGAAASDIASNSNAEAMLTEPTEADSSLERGSETEENSSKHAEHSYGNCPGHVDLYIQVKLLGLNDRNGLISIDAIGNDPDSITADGWQGWTEETLSYVNAISSQDWFADYGLSISAISLSTPLSGQEIADYMDQLPKDLSETRREIIHFALSSVGRVPYYWGGKASHAGYEGNQFGALVPSDHEGRILKGLDCSGWIDWVYWSATGKRLAGSSTSSLILCGEKISRSDLKPGDIIVRTGTSAHVVMFLSWSADGRMNVIHESSASVNNVTIKTMDAAWPYYRKLVD